MLWRNRKFAICRGVHSVICATNDQRKLGTLVHCIHQQYFCDSYDVSEIYLHMPRKRARAGKHLACSLYHPEAKQELTMLTFDARSERNMPDSPFTTHHYSGMIHNTQLQHHMLNMLM